MNNGTALLMISNLEIESIYNQHIDGLYNYAIYLGASKELAMDAIHDVFCKLCADEDAVRKIENAKFYLFRALKNNLLNVYKSSNFNTSSLSELHSEKDVSADIEELLISKEEEASIKEKIDQMLSSLTKRQREIIYLKYVQEYNYEQIAEIMQISYGSCRKLAHKALSELRKNYPYSILFIAILRMPAM